MIRACPREEANYFRSLDGSGVLAGCEEVAGAAEGVGTCEVWFNTITQLPARFCSRSVVCPIAEMGAPSTWPEYCHW